MYIHGPPDRRGKWQWSLRRACHGDLSETPGTVKNKNKLVMSGVLFWDKPLAESIWVKFKQKKSSKQKKKNVHRKPPLILIQHVIFVIHAN